MPRMQSSLSTRMACSTPSMLETMLRCESITPLGMPVEPLEKITVARESSLISLDMSQRRNRGRGSRRAASSVKNFCTPENSFAASSIMMRFSTLGASNRSSSFAVVKTVLIPQRSMAMRMASADAV